MSQSHVVSGDKDISLVTPQPMLKAGGSPFCDHGFLEREARSGPNAKPPSGARRCTGGIKATAGHQQAASEERLPRAGKYGLEATFSRSSWPETQLPVQRNDPREAFSPLPTIAKKWKQPKCPTTDE